jgi:polyhydroxybutyrate depolymerase
MLIVIALLAGGIFILKDRNAPLNNNGADDLSKNEQGVQTDTTSTATAPNFDTKTSSNVPATTVGTTGQSTSAHSVSGALAAGDYHRDVPGWPGRQYDLHVPKGYSGALASLVVFFHGGGGNSYGNFRISCPGGDPKSPECMSGLSDREGFVVIYPNGTASKLLPNTRTWNAGGGNEYVCVSGDACKANVDDVAYMRALLADLRSVVSIDAHRIYATGISNGAALSHRFACLMPDVFAAIAPVAGANQYETTKQCNPRERVAVMQIHGSEDTAWPYSGGVGLLETLRKTDGVYASTETSTLNWATRNQCRLNPSITKLPEKVNDGTSVTKIMYEGCVQNGDVILYKIEGGGHTWPSGWQYFPVSTVGKTTRNLNANEVIWNFFKNHRKP